MGPPAYSMHQVHAKCMSGTCQVHVRCISGCAANAYILHAPYMHACVLSWLVNIVTYHSLMTTLNHKLFKEEAGGKSFSFMGCYMILKDAPKWRVNSRYISDPALYTKKNKDKENPDKKQAPLERPIGNKAAKAARSLEEKQIEVDMRMAAVLETRAKCHKDQLTYKILVQIPHCDATKVCSSSRQRWRSPN